MNMQDMFAYVVMRLRITSANEGAKVVAYGCHVGT